MPFRSQAQAKWAFATRQPWARKWGHKTRLQGGINKLPQKVEQKEVPSATPAVGNASGPGGLFSASGLEKKQTSSVVNPSRRNHAPFGQRRPKSKVTYKEVQEHTGAMIALYLSSSAAFEVDSAARPLFGDKTEEPDGLHITLAYLGKMDEEELEQKIPILVPVVQQYINLWRNTVGIPMIAVLNGYGAFPEAIENGMVPIFRKVDSPLLKLWVDGLWRLLDFVGLTIHRNHGEYTPHVTVSYNYAELVELLPTAATKPVMVQFDHIDLCLGNVRIEMPFAVGKYKSYTEKAKSEQIAPGVYRIRGNLCQVAGKFGPCDGATSSGFNKKPKKPKGGKGGKPKKPAMTPEQKLEKRRADAQVRKQEAEAQRAQNRVDTLGKLSNRPNDQAMAALDTLRQGGTADPALMKSMEATGLVDKHSDGSYTLSANGHGLLNALDSGDPAKAVEAIAKGGDKVSKEAERARAREERVAERLKKNQERIAAKLTKEQERKQRHKETAERRAKKARGSGGGKEKPKHIPPTRKPAPAPDVPKPSPPVSTQPVRPVPVPKPSRPVKRAPRPGDTGVPGSRRNSGTRGPMKPKQSV